MPNALRKASSSALPHDDELSRYHAGVRIVSLLPSATEIVCALGAREQLVGRSHECDYPCGVEELPVLTSARIRPLASSRAIDAAVRDVLRDALAVYEIDLERLREVKPDVIVTQDLCDVCAVSLEDVRSAVARLARNDVRIVNLHPTRVEDIWRDVQRVADAIGRHELGKRLVADLKHRATEIELRAKRVTRRPTVLSLEWIEPVMVGGMWMPELVAMAGGEPLVTKPGQQAPTLTREQLELVDPDVVLIKPCGFDLDRTLKELHVLSASLPWESWRSVTNDQVFAADGNAFFNRPGPRIVESLEIMAACVHIETFPDFAAKHVESVLRVGKNLRASPLTVLDRRSDRFAE